MQPYILRPYFQNFPERRIDKSKATFLISNHHRLYIAHLKIIGDELKVIDIRFRKGRQEYESRIKETFPHKEDRKLSWFNGIILLGIDNDKNPIYSKAYYTSLFLKEHDKYIVLEFRQGNLTKELSFNKEEFNHFMDSQLEQFKSTERYEEERRKIINLLKSIYESNHKTWEINEEDIKKRLLRNLLFITKKVIEK